MKVKIFIIFLLTANNVFSQIPVFVEEYSINFHPVNCTDTISLKKDKLNFSFIVRDCKGEMSCSVYDGKILIEKGEYRNSLDTLKRYTARSARGSSAEPKMVVQKFFQPLRHGEWIFYDKKNKKYKKRHYNMGIELNENSN